MGLVISCSIIIIIKYKQNIQKIGDWAINSFDNLNNILKWIYLFIFQPIQQYKFQSQNRLISYFCQSMVFKGFYLILALLLVTSYSYSFCEVESAELKVYTTHQQIQKIPLDKHIRGFNMDFTTTDQSVVSIFEPYHIADRGNVTIKSGYSIVNIDGKNSNTNAWSRQGIIFAQGGQKNVSVGYGEFPSGVLPTIETYNYVELPYVSNCYSGLLANQNLDVVIDCQRQTSIKEQMSDLMCIITRSGKLKCKSFSSITRTSKRLSLVLTVGNEKFLFSAALTDHVSAQFQNQTFINIYHIVDENVEFNLIVDRRTLGLNSLSISDMEILQIDGDDYIVLTDANSRLIVFRYKGENTIEDVMVIPVNGVPRQFEETAEGTWLIAIQKYILQCNFLKSSTSLQIIRKYELDPSDNKVTDLQSSYLFVTVRTAQNHLYTYDRKYTELRYVLNKEDISQHTIYVVSPFYPRFFQINSTEMVSVAISSGYLFVALVQESKDVIIIGNSGNTSCVFNFRIEFISNAASKIYVKKNMTSTYRVESLQPTRFVLSDYFGGSNLRYNVNASKDLGYDLQHINSYKQSIPKNPTQQEAEILFTTVVDVDSRNYWIVKFSTEDVRFYKCQLKDGEVACTQNEGQRISSDGKKFNNADGKYRKDGRALVSWTYSDSNAMFFKYLGEKQITYIVAEPYTRFSQIVVGQLYTVLVQKQLNRITFYNGKKVYIFTKSSFTKEQLNAMGGGFYPREVSVSHKNNHIFYIKFPISIVTVSYQGDDQLQVLALNKISDTFIPDDLWSITVGKESLLLITPDEAAEYAVLDNSNIVRLHKISLDRKPIFPVRYQVETDTAYFQCEDNSIQYVRLNQPALDSQYYNVGLKNKINGKSEWDVSGSWLVTQNQAYFQYQEPALVIVSYVPDTVYREDLTLALTVQSENQKKQVVANVTALNYPVKIQASSEVDNGIILPEKGQNDLIPFPLDKYFIGSVADYRIVCPYCLDGSLTLVPPIRKINQNTDIKNFSALIGLEDNSGAVVVEQNKVKLINTNNSVIAQKVIESAGDCSTLGVNEGNLVVFCSGASNQEIVLYTVTHNDLLYVQTYFIPAQALIMNPSQINVYRKGNSNKLTVLVHDVDLMNPTAKNSNIKVFDISQIIQFKSQIDSSTFKLPNSEPVNSMSIHKNHMLVTIGGLGVGYINLANYMVGQFINLQTEPSLMNYTLDKTSYLRVVIHSGNQDKNTIRALVTTSNSYNYLLSFRVSDTGDVTFEKIVETYRRYGHQRCLNWALIDDKFVMIAFYNVSTNLETFALYKRSNQGLVDFFTSIHSTVPESGLQIPKATLLHAQTISQSSSFFYIKNDTRPGSPASLSLYNVTQQFHLLAKYDKPSSFQIIQVIAYNDYYSVSRDLKVQFEGNNPGVKWYSILIVCILVGIAVGVSLGFYLKMKKRRADSKKVSLFTENQEVDEQI